MLASYRVYGRFARTYTPLKGFPGTTLRGAFGYALRKASCRNEGDAECRDCRFYRDCVYARMFESSSVLDPSLKAAAKRGLEGVTNPYTIEVHRVGRERLSYSVNVFGEALKWEGYVVTALIGMGIEGIGIDPALGERRKFRVERIDRLNVATGDVEVVYTEDVGFAFKPLRDPGKPLLDLFERRAMEIVDARPTSILLYFKTPFKLVEAGKTQVRPRFSSIVMNLARKYSLLAAYHRAGRKIRPRDARGIKAQSSMVRLEGCMVSGRYRVKKKTIKGGEKDFGVFVRAALAYRVPREFWAGEYALTVTKLLLLGEYLHIGKMSCAGYGDYKLYLSTE